MSDFNSILEHRKSDRGTSQPVSELVSGIFSDAQTLIAQQVRMLTAEFHEDVRRTKETVQYLGVGIGLITTGGLALMFSIVYFLTWLFPDLPVGAAWFLVGCFCLGVGILFVLLGQRLLNSYNPLPHKTFNSLQENASWITRLLK